MEGQKRIYWYFGEVRAFTLWVLPPFDSDCTEIACHWMSRLPKKKDWCTLCNNFFLLQSRLVVFQLSFYSPFRDSTAHEAKDMIHAKRHR